MAYKNYAVSSAKGYMYEKSKEAKEGFEAVTSDRGTSYQRKVANIEGVITGFRTKKFDSGSTIIELVVKEGEDSHTLAVNLYTASGSNTREAQALISSMYGYKAGEAVTVSFSVKKTTADNGKEYENVNFWINYKNIQDDNMKNVSTGFIPYTDIPKPTTKVVAGETKYNFDDRVEFYYNKLQEISTRIGNAPAPVQQQSQVTSTAVNTTPPVSTIPAGAVEKSEDDLPFG